LRSNYLSMKPILFSVIVLLTFSTCNTPKKIESQIKSNTTATTTSERSEVKKPKNIIFMVGDGMGLSQITAGMYSNGDKLNLERMKTIGLHKSHAAFSLVTDSAAGATAFACGQKTYNGAIAVNLDTIAIPTILEEAEIKKLATGLVSTSTIVHATPASFIAHNGHRKNYEEIAADFLKTDIDCFIGGGAKYFNNREDGRDLLQELRNKGYQVGDYFNNELDTMQIKENENFAYLTSLADPIPAAQGRDYLQKASIMAIEALDKRDNGFFIMIEGSQIDWGGHSNDADYIITEMIDFDNTIGAVLDWAEQDGETLVIVTADHETGGFAIQKGSTREKLVTAFTSDYHTAEMICVFAHGPQEALFRGIYDNTAIYDKMREAYGWSSVFTK
jgi:alkaline phosphatase